MIAADFTEGQTVFPAIAERLKDLDVGILINNVGLSYLHPDYFLEVDKEVSSNCFYVKCGGFKNSHIATFIAF